MSKRKKVPVFTVRWSSTTTQWCDECKALRASRRRLRRALLDLVVTGWLEGPRRTLRADSAAMRRGK